MADTRTERIARIDLRIGAVHQAYLAHYFAGQRTEANGDSAEVDRLLDLRHRVQRGWPVVPK